MSELELHQGQSGALIIDSAQDQFNERQLGALRQLGVEEAGEGDLAVFLHQCQRTGLDPFARQIYMVGRRQKVEEWSNGRKSERWVTKYTIQTGIDGLRLVARRAVDRSRETFGYEDTLWCGPDGRWRDIWLETAAPAAAKVTVIRNGQRYPAVALLDEYAGTTKDGGLTKMWREKPALMIAKCAEALALRKAFPQDLSGIYTADEMGRSVESESAPQVQQPSPQPEQQPEQQPQAKPVMTDEQFSAALQQIAESTVQEDLDAVFNAMRGTDLAEHKDAIAQAWKERAEAIANPQPEPEPEQTVIDAEIEQQA